MKKLLIPLLVCTSYIGFALQDGPAKQKPKKPERIVLQATLQSPQLTSPGSMEIGIDEISTREEMLRLQQAYAAGGDSALEKALGKSHKGYCDLGSMGIERLQVVVVLLKSDGPRRRFEILAQSPSWSYFGQVFGKAPGYPYVFIQIEIDERGPGKGTFTPRTQVAFNPQGEIVLRKRSIESAHLAMVRAVN